MKANRRAAAALANVLEAEAVPIQFRLEGLALQMYKSLGDVKLDGKPVSPAQVAEIVFKQWIKQHAQV